MPNLTSESVILIEESSGRILFEKNSDSKMYPASLTKVATAIYAIERGNLKDIVTVSKNARQVDGTRVYLEEGEKVSLKKLIEGLLINSGNDAGVAIAEHLDGSEEEFAISINAYLKEIGVQNTHFENPHGLFNADHTTTARDLAKITQYAMKNEEFRNIFGTKELKWDGEAWDTTLYTHHKLMRERPYEGVTGGKTGYVDESGNTLITTAKRGDLSVIAVVLKGQSQDAAYSDTVKLLDYAFTNYKLVSIPKGKEYKLINNTFITKQKYSFPISNNEEIIEKIENATNLVIRNQSQELVASFPIYKIQKQVPIEDQQKWDEKEEELVKVEANNFFFISAIAVFGIYFFTKKTSV
ncbi:D-alanyl-D-alanine carboxypeptidase family protein [Schinkia azotoformans]|uniref:D-alanyl-D-alanine carboxypeptidase family protein n=1 Tax=Schinkia azotoformans TaxID=1454 RepID=UPI002DB7ACA0|nr:D-alanyl-D-alanine carboxypeptidase family protein [Schinkia azotoformans]